MKTLHSAFRVTDLAASLDFYTTLGYRQVGRVDLGDGASLTMLRFPDEERVTLELAYRPADGPMETGTGFSHLVVQVENLDATRAMLSRAGLRADVEHHGDPDSPRTAWLTDPDGFRIELVQWPSGHADGLTDADFS